MVPFLPIQLGGIVILSCSITRKNEPLSFEFQLALGRRQANKAKDLFLATISHELRLTTILSWAQILRMKKDKFDPETVFRGLEKIEDSAKTQEQLIRDLLDLSRIMTGKFSLEKQEIDPVIVIKTAVDSIRPQAEQKSIQIVVCFTEDVKPIDADPVRLKQVIWNLLSNSIKFSRPGGRIDVKVAEAESDLEISVTDYGKGISPELLPRLFLPFQQADASSTRRHGGLGLGLSIVKNIMDLQGGTVIAESRGEGTGAKFTVRLSKKPEQPGLVQKRGQASSGDHEASQQMNLEGLRILLVDDDENALESTQIILQSFGAKVLSVSSAHEALDVFENFNPHVLISDIAMPDEDGYSLLRKLRSKWQEKHCRPTPAIALTAYAAREDQKMAIEAGYQEHLAKPIDAVRLVSAVRKLAA